VAKRNPSVTISSLGEDRLVHRITQRLPSHPSLITGPGDDCAVVGKPRDRVWTLLKTDCVIEGIHFTADVDFSRVGWKALARNISDIAAMGGKPEHALITAALPPEMLVAKVDALYAGLKKCARQFDVSIAGGETSRSPGPVFISVALTGRVERTRCVFRSGGKPGDVLFVTGTLGGSIQGKHLDFTPRLAEARWLTEHFKVRAMMDLSDGLGADLPRLAKASGCGFEIAHIPATAGCSPEQALGDGEDFELLFAVKERDAAKLERDWPFKKLALTRIGSLTANRRRSASPIHGFDHFA